MSRTCKEFGNPASYCTVFGMSLGSFCTSCYRAANKRMIGTADTLLRPECVKCQDALTGHEDESGTLCRWCVTCQPVNEQSVAQAGVSA